MVSIVESKICTKISLFFFISNVVSSVCFISYWSAILRKPKGIVSGLVPWSTAVHIVTGCDGFLGPQWTSHLYSWRLLAIRSTLALSTSYLLQSSSLAACPMIFPLKILFLISSGFIQMFEIQCSSARFGSAYTKSGMI